MAGDAGVDADALLAALGASGGLEDDVALLVAHAVPVDRERLDLSLDAVPGTLAPLRRAVRRWLDANGVGALVAYDILLAVNESATNAIEHAYGPGAARFDVHVRRDADAVEIGSRPRSRCASSASPWRSRRATIRPALELSGAQGEMTLCGSVDEALEVLRAGPENGAQQTG